MSSRLKSRPRIAPIPLLPGVAVIAVIAGLASATAAPAALAKTSPTCGKSAATNGAGTATRPAALKVLVPLGADSLLVCRYGGLSTSKSTMGLGLTASGRTSSAGEVKKITDGLDAIKASRHVICPDFEVLGGETLTFFYRSGPSVILSVNLGGCLEISNGHVTRPALDEPVLSEIEALLRPVKAAG